MSLGIEQLDAGELGDLRKVFFAQSAELLENVQDALLRLERDAVDPETLRSVKRSLHTVKGDATSMGFEEVGHLCHRLEDVLAVMSADPSRVPGGVEILMAGRDALERSLADLERGGSGGPPADLVGRIERFAALAAAPDGGVATAQLTEYGQLQARAALARGEELFELEVTLHPDCRERQVGALLIGERLRSAGTLVAVWPDPEDDGSASSSSFRFLAGATDQQPLRAACAMPGVAAQVEVRPWRPAAGAGAAPAAPAAASAVGPEHGHGEVLRVEAAKIDQILDLVGELIIGRSMLEQATREADTGTAGPDLAERLHAVGAYLERTVGDLQKSAMRMRMVPIRFLFKKFPRVVRDLANQLGKRIRLDIEGQETELDKGIVDVLFVPLTHLVRNMADHGLGTPEERRAAGKAEEGRIQLRAFQEAASIVIEVADDGRGIDAAKLARSAVERGCIGEEAARALSREDALRLVFLSGVSTAQSVTETSGRGVGMDAVKSAMDAVKGSIEIESAPGEGTCFRLRLPLTLAVLRSLLFDVGERLFALPVAAIAEVVRIHPGDLTSVDGQRCLLLRDRVVSVLSVGELFNLSSSGETGRYLLVLTLRGRRFGLLVERLRWQQELVIKSVDERWIDAGTVAGASILGDGRVVLILDAAAIVARGAEQQRARLEAR